MRRVVIAGAAGRDFHNFNVVYRGRDDVEVVAFTATQIPDIDGRVYPAALAGSRYPEGIPILPEEELAELVRRDVPYYQAAITPQTVGGLNQFARRMGILQRDVSYDAVVATQLTSNWT